LHTKIFFKNTFFRAFPCIKEYFSNFGEVILTMKAFLRFFLAWYFPVLGSMYFLYLLTGSEHITDRANLLVPAVVVAMLYLYHRIRMKKQGS